MQPIALLCEIIAQGRKVAASAYTDVPSFAALLTDGFLETAGVIQSIPCSNCDALHDAEIVHHDGRAGYFCAEAGFIPVGMSEISAVRAGVPMIIAALADAFECRARKSSPIAGATWRVGRVASDTGDLVIYFHPTLQTANDVTDVLAALALEPGSTYRLILSGTGDLQMPGMKTVPLSEVIELDTPGAGFRPIADLRDLVGAPRKNPGGAPSRYGEALTRLINERMTSGMAFEGRNAEAKAVLSKFIELNPGQKPPSTSLVRDYVSKMRTGQ
ncbi:MAG: hypothetical protein AAF871_07540 [Pseudomonadota bacterium]